MTKRFVGAVVILLAFGLVPVFVEASGPKATVVRDPYEAEHFSCAGRPDGRFHNHPNESSGYSGFRIVADLNFDGRQDLILSTGGDPDDGYGGCGNAGCSVTIYLLQADKTYRGIGFFLHPFATASRKITQGRGTLAIYGRMSVDEGSFDSYEVGAHSVTAAKSVVLHMASKQDQETYERWFGRDKALRAEYSRCSAGKLAWSSSYE